MVESIVIGVVVVSFAFMLKINGNNKVKRKDCEDYRKTINDKLIKIIEGVARIEGSLEIMKNNSRNK